MRQEKRTFSDADMQAHRRLRAFWDTKARSLGLTQAKAAGQFGGTQALINAYLTGRAALGRAATMKFARILQVRPEDIRPDFRFSRELAEDFPEEVLEMACKLATLPEAQRRELLHTIEMLLRARHYEALLEQVEGEAGSRPKTLRRR